MKPDCHPNELALSWTLSQDERVLLANKTGATRLAFALLLKLFGRDGRLRERREESAGTIVTYLAQQVGGSPDVYLAVDWSERTQRQQRAQIRDHCGFGVFGAQDEAEFVAHLSARVTPPNPEAETLKLAAYGHLRAQHSEPPKPARLRRLLHDALRQRENLLIADTVVELCAPVCAALDALIQTSTPDQDNSSVEQASLFPIRSELATIKEDAGALKVETVLEEIEKLKHLRYKLAKAAKGQPDGRVKDVISPAVGEQTLEEVIREAEADAGHERQVKLVTRASYSHHYRRIVPALLSALEFKCNNERHRAVMEALALLQRYRDRKSALFGANEDVPLDGVVKDDWQELVLDQTQGGRINRISYEVCVLTTLREKVRCKELWVAGGQRFGNPDEDLAQDFDARRDQ